MNRAMVLRSGIIVFFCIIVSVSQDAVLFFRTGNSEDHWNRRKENGDSADRYALRISDKNN